MTQFEGAPDFLQVSRNVLVLTVDQSVHNVPAMSVGTFTYGPLGLGDVLTVNVECAADTQCDVTAFDPGGLIVERLGFMAAGPTVNGYQTVAIEPRGGNVVLRVVNAGAGVLAVTVGAYGWVGAALDDVTPRLVTTSTGVRSGLGGTGIIRLPNASLMTALDYIAVADQFPSNLLLTEFVGGFMTVANIGLWQVLDTIPIPAASGYVRGHRELAGLGVQAQVTTSSGVATNMFVQLKGTKGAVA